MAPTVSDHILLVDDEIDPSSESLSDEADLSLSHGSNDLDLPVLMAVFLVKNHCVFLIFTVGIRLVEFDGVVQVLKEYHDWSSTFDVLFDILDDLLIMVLPGNYQVPIVFPFRLFINRGDDVVLLNLVFVLHNLFLALGQILQGPRHPDYVIVHLGEFSVGHFTQGEVDGTSRGWKLSNHLPGVLVKVGEYCFVPVRDFVRVPILIFVGYLPICHLILMAVVLHAVYHVGDMVLYQALKLWELAQDFLEFCRLFDTLKEIFLISQGPYTSEKLFDGGRTELCRWNVCVPVELVDEEYISFVDEQHSILKFTCVLFVFKHFSYFPH